MVMDAILATAGCPEGLYGRRKMTHHVRRAGHQVAFCTVDRLMADLGRNGIRRGKGVRTTVPARDGNRAEDLLNRDFTAAAPNTRWVADFTYCRTWAGFCYVAFIVDVFAQKAWPGTRPPISAPTWCSPRYGSRSGTATAMATLSCLAS